MISTITSNHKHRSSNGVSTENNNIMSQCNLFDAALAEMPGQTKDNGSTETEKMSPSKWQKNIEAESNTILDFEDGSRYQGAIKNGKAHGYGKQIFLNNTNYEGQFENGLPHGHGTLTYSDGSKYEGTFIRGSRNGNICLTLPNGTKVNGSFTNGDFVGTVTYVSS